MMLLGLLRSSPVVQAVMATVLAFAIVAGGVGMLRRDARVQAVAQCAAEKEVAGLKRQLADQTRIAAAHEADAKRAADAIHDTNQQLAASEAALQKAMDDAAQLRAGMARNPGETDVVFPAGDDWLSRRVRPSGSSSPAAGRGR